MRRAGTCLILISFLSGCATTHMHEYHTGNPYKPWEGKAGHFFPFTSWNWSKHGWRTAVDPEHPQFIILVPFMLLVAQPIALAVELATLPPHLVGHAAAPYNFRQAKARRQAAADAKAKREAEERRKQTEEAAQTPLTKAVRARDLEGLRALAASESDLDKLDGRGDTPLALAAAAGETAMLEVLLDASAKPDARDRAGTPLHAAARAGKAAAIRLLLERGADPKQKDPEGLDALDLAVKGSHFDAVKALLAAGAEPSDPALALAEERPAVRTLLLETKAQASERKGDEEGRAGRPRAALALYVEGLRSARSPDLEARLREKAIRAAARVQPAPEIPEEARRHAAKARSVAESGPNEAGLRTMVSELAQAVVAAPWWGTPYLNMASAQERLGDYEGAVRSLEAYRSITGGDDSELSERISRLEELRYLGR